MVEEGILADSFQVLNGKLRQNLKAFLKEADGEEEFFKSSQNVKEAFVNGFKHDDMELMEAGVLECHTKNQENNCLYLLYSLLQES